MREVIGGNKFSLLNKLLGYDDPTIDVENLFLKKPSEYLHEVTYLTYRVDVNFIRVTSYEELLQQNGYTISYVPEYVLIELPPVLYYPYPADLFKNVDLPLLVCRSNRIWSEADQSVLDVLAKIGNQKVNFVLNGVGLQAIESVIGELPKRRSIFRRKVKRLLSFQFRSENQL
jgi:polysaccharide biosynthesis transport protein